MTQIPSPTAEERVADALFRGVSAQLVRGVLRWLELRGGQILVCERDEDFDIVDTTGAQLRIVAEQIKADAGRVSARSDRVQETIANFAIAFHRYKSTGQSCEFIYSTSAGFADQTTDDRVTVNVLKVWAEASATTDLSKRTELIASIKELEAAFRAKSLRSKKENPKRVALVEAAFDYLDKGHWDAFLLAVRWIPDIPEYAKVRADAEVAIEADDRFRNLPRQLVFERLLVEVLESSSHKNIDERVLTREGLGKVASSTRSELEEWLAGRSAVLRRLAEHDAKLAEHDAKLAEHDAKLKEHDTALTKLSQVVSISRRPPSLDALRPPTSFAKSARLEEVVDAIEGRLAAGAKAVALRGAPGDGKTQAACQLGTRSLSVSYWELPNAGNASKTVDATEVWRVGLGGLASTMSGESCDDLDLDAIARIVRERMGFLPRPHLLILDNADSDAPIDLRRLLADGAAVVPVGGGTFEFAESIALRPASPNEFVQMVNEAAAPRLIAPTEKTLVEEIGALVDHSPLIAGLIAPFLNRQFGLRDLRDELASGGAEPRGRMHLVFLKTWRNLSAAAGQLALLLGAWAEPDVPISWIPPLFRKGDAVEGLARSRLATEVVTEGEPSLRVHRLVIHWIRTTAVATMDAVAPALLDWASAPELNDELKSGGKRKLAFVRAFEIARARGALARVAPDDLALIQSTYIDQSTVFGSDVAAIERQVHVLAPTAEDLVGLHPAVLGQMTDALREAVVEGSTGLRALRNRTIELLGVHVASLANAAEITILDEIAEHHFGKYLLFVDDGAHRQEGLTILQRADAQSTTALETATGPSRTQWLIRRSKTRSQICDQQGSPISTRDAIPIMRAELANDELPAYVRLVAARQLLRRADGLESHEAVRTLRSGLELLPQTKHYDVATLFLSEASKVAAKSPVKADPVAAEIESTLERWLERLLTSSVPLSQRGTVAVAFGNAKIAEGQDGASGWSRLLRALLLLERVLDASEFYHRERALAILRDAGAAGVAAAIAHQDRDTDSYYGQYEIVETWRWTGAFDQANELLEAMAADPKNAKNLAWINDERARLAGKKGDLDRARALLEANIPQWMDAGEFQHAELCKTWRRSLDEGRMHAADALLEDEWRSAQRSSSVSRVELDALQQVADRMARGIIAVERRRKPKRKR